MPLPALKILDIRQYACGFLPCHRQNLAANPHTAPIDTGSYFYGTMNSTFRRKKNRRKYWYVPDRLLRAEVGEIAYMIRRPRTEGLLYDLMDGNLLFDIFPIGRAMICGGTEYFFDSTRRIVTAEKAGIPIPRTIDINSLAAKFGYSTFEELKQAERENVLYADFLRKLKEIMIERSLEWCGENNIKCLINSGQANLIFPYPDIGFFEREMYKAYYCPFFGSLVYEDGFNKFCDRSFYIGAYSNANWDSGNELIEVPRFTTPKAILQELGLSAEKRYDAGFMDYYLHEIYYDYFWNEYGIRSKEEQLMIHDCIWKYKLTAYDWFTDRGARIPIEVKKHLTNGKMCDIMQ